MMKNSFYFIMKTLFVLKKSKFIRESKLIRKLETPVQVFRAFKAAKYHRLYRQIFFNGKDGFFVDA